MLLRLFSILMVLLLFPLKVLAEARNAIMNPSPDVIHTQERMRGVRQYVHDSVRAALTRPWKGYAPAIARAILRESAENNIDPLLVMAVIQQESRFNPNARGAHRELGLMQIKPTTARWLANRFALPFKGRKSLLNPVTNIRFGTRYLAYLRDRFNSQSHLYMAAYNMGATSVHRAVRKRRLPREYSKSVLRFYQQHSLALAEQA